MPTSITQVSPDVIDTDRRDHELASLKRLAESDPVVEGRLEKLARSARIAARVDPDTEAELIRLMACRAVGADPDTGELQRCNAGSSGVHRASVTNPTAPGSDQHRCGVIVMQASGGLTRRIRVNCHQRGCPTCGDAWGYGWHDAAETLIEREARTSGWVVVDVANTEARALSKAMTDARHRGYQLDGIAFPIDSDRRRYLIHGGDALPERWGARSTSDPVAMLDDGLLAIYAAVRNGEERSAVRGVGEWYHGLAEARREQRAEPSDQWETLGIATRELPFADLVEKARDLGGLVDARSTADRMIVKFRNDIDRDRWLWVQRFVTIEQVLASAAEARSKREIEAAVKRGKARRRADDSERIENSRLLRGAAA